MHQNYIFEPLTKAPARYICFPTLICIYLRIHKLTLASVTCLAGAAAVQVQSPSPADKSVQLQSGTTQEEYNYAI